MTEAPCPTCGDPTPVELLEEGLCLCRRFHDDNIAVFAKRLMSEHGETLRRLAEDD